MQNENDCFATKTFSFRWYLWEVGKLKRSEIINKKSWKTERREKAFSTFSFLNFPGRVLASMTDGCYPTIRNGNYYLWACFLINFPTLLMANERKEENLSEIKMLKDSLLFRDGENQHAKYKSGEWEFKSSIWR